MRITNPSGDKSATSISESDGIPSKMFDIARTKAPLNAGTTYILGLGGFTDSSEEREVTSS